MKYPADEITDFAVQSVTLRRATHAREIGEVLVPIGHACLLRSHWFAFIGKPLLWLLQKFQEVVGNWGIAIILLTIVVKLLTLYWTTKSMRSMKEMAALAPQMKALQTKYADDKQRQQAETMALSQHELDAVVQAVRATPAGLAVDERSASARILPEVTAGDRV